MCDIGHWRSLFTFYVLQVESSKSLECKYNFGIRISSIEVSYIALYLRQILQKRNPNRNPLQEHLLCEVRGDSEWFLVSIGDCAAFLSRRAQQSWPVRGDARDDPSSRHRCLCSFLSRRAPQGWPVRDDARDDARDDTSSRHRCLCKLSSAEKLPETAVKAW